MTDTIAEIRARHEAEDATIEANFGVLAQGWATQAHADRAVLLARVAELEAAGVRLVYSGEAPAQLIDGDERTTVRIFTPYAPANPGAITGIRKAETPCSDCIDGWCQMNCGPRVG